MEIDEDYEWIELKTETADVIIKARIICCIWFILNFNGLLRISTITISDFFFCFCCGNASCMERYSAINKKSSIGTSRFLK
jgi:hypothetical protein